MECVTQIPGFNYNNLQDAKDNCETIDDCSGVYNTNCLGLIPNGNMYALCDKTAGYTDVDTVFANCLGDSYVYHRLKHSGKDEHRL